MQTTQNKKGPVRRALGFLFKSIGVAIAIVLVLVLAAAAPQAIPALAAVIIIITAFVLGYKYLKRHARNDNSIAFARTLTMITGGACLLDTFAMLVLKVPVVYGNMPWLWVFAGRPEIHGGFHLSYLVVDLVSAPLMVLLVRFLILRRKKAQVQKAQAAQAQPQQAQP